MSEYGWTHAIAKHPDYANKLGIITAEWSALEWHLCLLFQHLLGVDGQRAEAVFFTITNNRSRREAIASLANLLLPEGNELRDRTDRILRRVSNAATRRNSMAHAIWHFGETPGSGSTINLKRESGILISTSMETKALDHIILQLRILRKETHELALAVKGFLSSVSPAP